MAAGLEDAAASAESEMVGCAPCPPPPPTSPAPLRLTPDVLLWALKKYGVGHGRYKVDTSVEALVKIEETAAQCFGVGCVSDLHDAIAYLVCTSVYTTRPGFGCSKWVAEMRKKYDRGLPAVLLHGAREAGLVGPDGAPCPHRERRTDHQRWFDLDLFLADM